MRLNLERRFYKSLLFDNANTLFRSGSIVKIRSIDFESFQLLVMHCPVLYHCAIDNNGLNYSINDTTVVCGQNVISVELCKLCNVIEVWFKMID